jgi:predicted MFS family arabinose efflux permease
LVIGTAGFFGAHAIASGWTGREATVGKAQAASLYTLFFYGGSSVVGWFGGVALDAAGWPAVTLTIVVLAGVAAVLALVLLRRD